MRSALPLLLSAHGLAQEAPVPRVEASLIVQAPAVPGDLHRDRSLSGRAASAEGKALAIGADGKVTAPFEEATFL